MAHEQITLPARLKVLIESDRALYAAVSLSIDDFEIWLADNKMPFFPEYTDHSPTHVREVIESATALIPDSAWRSLTPDDGAALVLASLLHDCAMHLSEDGFVDIITGTFTQHNILAIDKPWRLLWDEYLSESSRFDGRKLKQLFGEARKPQRPPLSPNEMTRNDRLLIGDFLRRHHPRLAHEIALWGVPGPRQIRLEFTRLSTSIRNASGLIARSHGIELRAAVDMLPHDERRQMAGVHVPYIMALLRIADYIQIRRERAPGQLLMVRSLTSPLSRSEWRAHAAVIGIHAAHDDPEALFVKAIPEAAGEFVKLQRLFASIQYELDQSWAVLGEVYGRIGALNGLGLTIRRLRSNLDDVKEFSRSVEYLPRSVRFDSAGADLLKLLIQPLYGDRPEVGIRELLQNSLDAIRERLDLESVYPPTPIVIDVVTSGEDIYVKIEDAGVGMTSDIIVDYFLKAGASFRNSDAWRVAHTTDGEHSRVLRSGRFGVGALAAFLLGDVLQVQTRHVASERGLAFTASIDDDTIELRRMSMPSSGTTVRIGLTPRAAAKLTGNVWDWYCLEEPKVVRYLNNQPLKQAASWPKEGSELPPEWRRIQVPDYSDVQWSCWGQYSEPYLVVNGIRVFSDPDTSHYGRQSGKPGFLYRVKPRDEESVSIGVPRISVFDPDGNLPLTLQRNALTSDVYPFHEALLKSVVEDLVAYLIVSAPHRPDALDEWGYNSQNRVSVASHDCTHGNAILA